MKLAVPDMISNSYFPAIAAIELGFFRQEGLDVELQLIFPVDKAYAALRDGAIDLVAGSAHSALAAFPQWQGVKLICDEMSLMYLVGTEIDYVEGLHGAGFKFNNPNVKSTCGCGSSFSV